MSYSLVKSEQNKPPFMSVHLSSMTKAAPPRMMLRHARMIARQSPRRHASTTEAAKEAAVKSKATASDATSKASQGLSRVTSSAGPAVSGATHRVTKAIGNIGGRTGRMISFVQCEPNPVLYSRSYSANQLKLPELFRMQQWFVSRHIFFHFEH